MTTDALNEMRQKLPPLLTVGVPHGKVSLYYVRADVLQDIADRLRDKVEERTGAPIDMVFGDLTRLIDRLDALVKGT